MNKLPLTLEQHIVAALDNPNASAAELGELVAQTELAIAAAEETVTTARAKAADVLAAPTPREAQDALADAHAAKLTGDRLHGVLPKLREKLTGALEAERHSRWLAEYRRVATERDALAREFADTYPAIVAKLADLFGRMAACDLKCAEVNSSASALRCEQRRLIRCELHARGLEAFSRDYRPEIAKAVVLPDFVESDRTVWPPKQPSMAVAYAETLMVPAHPGSHWADDDVRRQRRKESEKEQRRISDFYQEQTASQEDRLNAEERQRFDVLRRPT
jgi:hypothetical protein